jgi:hypothetical protein
MDLFERLESWLDSNREVFERFGLTVGYARCKPTNNPAAYFDVDTDTIMARAEVWQSLEVNLTIIKLGSGEQLLFEYYHLADEAELPDLLSEFFVRCSRFR